MKGRGVEKTFTACSAQNATLFFDLLQNIFCAFLIHYNYLEVTSIIAILDEVKKASFVHHCLMFIYVYIYRGLEPKYFLIASIFPS